MKLSLPLLLSLTGLPLLARAQSVGIGTAAPATSAALEVRAANKGVLLPQVSLLSLTDAATVPGPAPALLVFNTNAALPGGVGFYYNAGTAAAPAWTRLTTGASWSLTGNAGTDSVANYLGTKDTKPVRLAVNGVEQARLHVNGAWWLGGAPYGGSLAYPDNHLLIGYQAGKKLPAGSYNNQFVGYQAGLLTTGNSNQFTGFQAGYANTTGADNYFSGLRAGFANTTGNSNFFEGEYAGYANTTGGSNYFAGYYAGLQNTTASYNHFVGYQAGFNTTTGNQNVFEGYQAGLTNSLSSNNSYLGYSAGLRMDGSNNVVMGSQAGAGLIGNSSSLYVTDVTLLGYQAGQGNAASELVAVGSGAGVYNSGGANCFVGTYAGQASTAGSNNLFAGYKAGQGNASGNFNTYVGGYASRQATGDYNTTLGAFSGNNLRGTQDVTLLGYLTDINAAVSNAAAIGSRARADDSNLMAFGSTATLRWVFGRTNVASPLYALQVGSTSSNGNGAYLSTGGTWTNASDVHLKENVQPADGAAVLGLLRQLPLSCWTYRGTQETHLGPMAQDFYRLFHLGLNDTSISTIDPAGVALVGVQELARQHDALQAENEQLRRQLGALQGQQADLAARLTALEQAARPAIAPATAAR